MKNNLEQNLQIGDGISIEGVMPLSVIVGLDVCKVKTLEGKRFEWNSYTCASEIDARFERFWLADHPVMGLCYGFLDPVVIPETAHPLMHASGVCEFDMSGDTQQDNASYSSLLVCYDPVQDQYYFQEVYSDDSAPIGSKITCINKNSLKITQKDVV